MRYFRYAIKEHSVTLYPIVCWHIGAKQSDAKFITETLYRIKHDPRAKVLYLGDGGECVTRGSKGDVFSQTMNIQEQFNHLVSLLHPIREKMLFGIRGNHGHRTFKETGMEFDESLMLALQVPYLGVNTFWNLVVNHSVYDIFCHHGMDSGVNVGTKINKAKKFEELVVADAIFSAHSHICCEVPPRHIATLEQYGNNVHTSPVKWVTTFGYVCGCAYDSRSGYAEDKGYSPIIPGHLAVTFGGSRQDLKRDDGKVVRGVPVKTQSCQIWRATA